MPDYDTVGSSPAEVTSRLVNAFTKALVRGKRPAPHMIWGPPGVGKTFTVYAAAKEIGDVLAVKCDAKSLLIACMDPTDVVGVPFPNPEHPYSDYRPLAWAWQASIEYEQDAQARNKDFKAPPMILFFDDLPVAHPQTQAAFFKVVHEGMVGDLTLRPNVMLVAAGNRVEDAAAAQEMPTALASRFRHIYFRTTQRDWLEWAINSGVHPFVTGYIHGNADHLHDFDPTRPEKAFACPRTWEMVSDALFEHEAEFKASAADKRKSANTSVFKITAGIIGEGKACSFHAFIDNTRHSVPPEEIVKAPDEAPVPKRDKLDALHATVYSMQHYVNENHSAWKPALIYSIRKEMLPELGLILAKAAVDVIFKHLDETARLKAVDSDAFATMFDIYGEYLQIS